MHYYGKVSGLAHKVQSNPASVPGIKRACEIMNIDYSDIHSVPYPFSKNTYTLQSVHTFFLSFYYQNDIEHKHTYTI